ncbi:hypothetical protein [Photobacterium leiognathi]|uniref:hypothetical protein n=1 Tax=Photobacterium leiognathi TaxID=553611 RepID=UPI002980C132|nr:hypothetical protein [Photobacterium leiognathi]
MNSSFNIPVALFIFKRKDSVLKILEVLAKVKPSKIYLLSDGGRNEDEKKIVDECRFAIEEAISWNCEIVKKYHTENVGVYSNIADGAKWVFSQEEKAIFLEDDNLPEETFFEYCECLLNKYRLDSRILWVCGSNYLEEVETSDNSSYFFTQNMLPCGWASWAYKFNNYYDGELKLWKSEYLKNRIKDEYLVKKLYKQDRYNIEYELEHKNKTGRFYSWDYQMSFSMRVHNVYAVVPKYNQIKNIGVDNNSTHGGNSLDNVMVERFCERKTKKLEFPLTHPQTVLIDIPLDKKLANIIIDPSFYSLKAIVSRTLRDVFKIDKSMSISTYFKTLKNGKK